MSFNAYTFKLKKKNGDQNEYQMQLINRYLKIYHTLQPKFFQKNKKKTPSSIILGILVLIYDISLQEIFQQEVSNIVFCVLLVVCDLPLEEE